MANRFNRYFWLRVGDADTYHDCDDLHQVADRVTMFGVYGVDCWRQGGFEYLNLRGDNYVSLYVGDADANRIRDLNDREKAHLQNIL